MYICICNAITEKDLIDSPQLNIKVGTVCGQCLDNEDHTKKIKAKKENSHSWTHSNP
jgi:bacterioferritin-associated ferredoxin